MLTSPRRSVAAACLVLPPVLGGCAGSDTSSTTAAPAQTPSGRTDDGAQEVSLTVSGGAVAGDTGRVRVELGSRVRVTVLADVADEVHVHGYDVSADTAAGRPATLELVADQPGVFEVELERARVLLTRLQVQ